MSNPVSKPAGLPLLSIGTVARLTGKSAPAIRYYEQIGLLPQPARVSGRRRYDPDTVRTLAVIETGQRAGLTLDEIKVLLSASPGDPAAIGRLREVADRKLPEIIALIERSQLVRSWLECAARCECPDLDQCPLFDDPALPPRHDSAPARRRRSPKPDRPLPSDAPAGPVTLPGCAHLNASDPRRTTCYAPPIRGRISRVKPFAAPTTERDGERGPLAPDRCSLPIPYGFQALLGYRLNCQACSGSAGGTG